MMRVPTPPPRQCNGLVIPSRIRDEALRTAASAGRVTIADITGRSRERRIAYPRFHAMWLLHAQGYSYPEIGRAIGRNHTTVINGVARHIDNVSRAAGPSSLRGSIAA